MPRKINGSRDAPANDSPEMLAMPESATESVGSSVGKVSMTTSPAFDKWLDRQMKTLLAACDSKPDQALLDLIRREFSKTDDKVTE